MIHNDRFHALHSTSLTFCSLNSPLNPHWDGLMFNQVVLNLYHGTTCHKTMITIDNFDYSNQWCVRISPKMPHLLKKNSIKSGKTTNLKTVMLLQSLFSSKSPPRKNLLCKDLWWLIVDFRASNNNISKLEANSKP